jgi:glycosyl transferase family 25
MSIDHVFYINLDRREDRREQIEGELARAEIEGERFSAIPHEFGIAGCTMSHLAVLKLARERGYRNVLILEDDLELCVPPAELRDTLAAFFALDCARADAPEPWCVLMLAYNTTEGALAETNEGALVDFPGTDLVRRVVHARTASFYLVNAHYYDTLIALYEDAAPKLIDTRKHWIYANDCVWRGLQLRDLWLASTKRMGKQRASWSDNSKCWADYNV